MQVGALGNISFVVSDSEIKTLTDLEESGSVQYATHEIHNGKSILEYTGQDPDQITFTMQLNQHYGANPMTELNKIRTAMTAGTTMPLVIGERSYGTYRWVITSYKMSAQHYDRKGNVTVMEVSVTLEEYVK